MALGAGWDAVMLEGAAAGATAVAAIELSLRRSPSVAFEAKACALSVSFAVALTRDMSAVPAVSEDPVPLGREPGIAVVAVVSVAGASIDEAFVRGL